MPTPIPTDLFNLQNNLLMLYSKLRQNAIKSGDTVKYNKLKALQPEVNKACFSNDINYVQSVFDKVLALV